MYDIFFIGVKNDTYEYLKANFVTAKYAPDFLTAQSQSLTDFFWVVPDDVSIVENFTFDYEPDDWSSHYNHVFLNDTKYDGVCLIPKDNEITLDEIEKRCYNKQKQVELQVSVPKPYDKFYIETYDDYKNALESSNTAMFWALSHNLELKEDFDFDLHFAHDNIYDKETNHVFVHEVNEQKLYNGVALLTKARILTKKEIEHRFIVNRKEWNIVASGPVKYNKFVIDSWEDYQYALKNSKTEMFWGTSVNIDTSGFAFDTYFTHDNEYDRKTNHAFIHRVDDKDLYNGVFLFSKHASVSQREIEHRFIVNHKPWDVVASKPIQYDKFPIDSYQDYVTALNSSTTEMFWGIPKDVDVADDFKFDLYFEHSNTYDRSVNHAFLNNDTYDGIMLFSNQSPVSQREVDYRFYANKKEWDIVASTPKPFDVFNIDTYEQYLQALDNTTTELFWFSTNNIALDETFVNSFYISHHEQIDRKQNHSFVHKVEDKDLRTGAYLCSIHKPVSKKEIEHRHLVERKEWNDVASGPAQYDRFNVESWEDYLRAVKMSKTELFYADDPNIDTSKFKFNMYFDHSNTYDRKQNHAFVHKDGSETGYNGLFLLSKQSPITKKEIEHRFVVNHKPWNIIASEYKIYDVVFISYQEPNADENYELLLERVPNAKRVHGVKGIHQAHIEAAKLCETEMFWIVDGDAQIVDDFSFEYRVPRWDRDMVHVWRTQNPINDLVYGYGGLKLFPRMLTINMDTSKPDMTTSITNKFKAVQQISNLTCFNTGPFETWKSAFRECCKLSSGVIDRQKDLETQERLDIWCTKGTDKPYGEYAIAGAKAGAAYGKENATNIAALKLINDFDWLKDKFNADT